LSELEQGEVLLLDDLRRTLMAGADVVLQVKSKGKVRTSHSLTLRQLEVVLAGGLINWRRSALAAA
jgi:aconitate hydratase